MGKEDRDRIQMCRGYKCAGVHAQGDTHAQMKTEESPVLLMRLLAHGRSGDGADVFYRGCSK